MTKLTITWKIEENSSDARADKETGVLTELEGNREHIEEAVIQIKGYIDLYLENDIRYDEPNIINVQKIVDETGLNEQEIRTVLVRLTQTGVIESEQIPTYQE